MNQRHAIALGKIVKRIASLRGGGSALPGLVIEKVDPAFMKRTLEQLPHGVVLVSGTNGKTTTTKIVSELLTASGLSVFTNRTGSNFTRGVAAALLDAVDAHGAIHHDIAVLELDEAYAAQFVTHVKPRYSMLLNVMRDQLDRFGEIDHTAKLLETVAVATTECVVLNRDDPRVSAIAQSVDPSVTIRYFGTSSGLRELFVNDDELHSKKDEIVTTPRHKVHTADVELTGFKDSEVTFSYGSSEYSVSLKLSGVYNYLNAAGALALAQSVVPEKSSEFLVSSLGSIQPAFGRGETFTIHGNTLELILVKNPSGFRLALSSFDPLQTDTMIAINDRYADGRDMSWLWDVDFTGLRERGVHMVSGIRAYDMALRLQYDDVQVGAVETNLQPALQRFLQQSKNSHSKRIFCTYTSMIAIRKLLKHYTDVEHIS